jgi:hypothetical protein
MDPCKRYGMQQWRVAAALDYAIRGVRYIRAKRKTAECEAKRVRLFANGFAGDGSEVVRRQKPTVGNCGESTGCWLSNGHT